GHAKPCWAGDLLSSRDADRSGFRREASSLGRRSILVSTHAGVREESEVASRNGPRLAPDRLRAFQCSTTCRLALSEASTGDKANWSRDASRPSHVPFVLCIPTTARIWG